ncbi:hypothetical protein M514_14073 [Trichuris suis]|uniref:Uncharacterized protein n=1 Tax=Trichuris suis TaxID=68888 RepID=A0A085LJA6_9BILA|nr:hypothetical protein M513_14073 [Trichuris suis]KFD59400.1 hypothetical protein M514_14073 [Trichuris suis]
MDPERLADTVRCEQTRPSQGADSPDGNSSMDKGEVRPVLDFRELNGHIETYTAEADVCASKLREWR